MTRENFRKLVKTGMCPNCAAEDEKIILMDGPIKLKCIHCGAEINYNDDGYPTEWEIDGVLYDEFGKVEE